MLSATGRIALTASEIALLYTPLFSFCERLRKLSYSASTRRCCVVAVELRLQAVVIRLRIFSAFSFFFFFYSSAFAAGSSLLLCLLFGTGLCFLCHK